MNHAIDVSLIELDVDEVGHVSSKELVDVERVRVYRCCVGSGGHGDTAALVITIMQLHANGVLERHGVVRELGKALANVAIVLARLALRRHAKRDELGQVDAIDDGILRLELLPRAPRDEQAAHERVVCAMRVEEAHEEAGAQCGDQRATLGALALLVHLGQLRAQLGQQQGAAHA